MHTTRICYSSSSLIPNFVAELIKEGTKKQATLPRNSSIALPCPPMC